MLSFPAHVNVHTTPSGIIRSHNYPWNYTDNSLVMYYITVEAGNVSYHPKLVHFVIYWLKSRCHDLKSDHVRLLLETLPSTKLKRFSLRRLESDKCSIFLSQPGSPGNLLLFVQFHHPCRRWIGFSTFRENPWSYSLQTLHIWENLWPTCWWR